MLPECKTLSVTTASGNIAVVSFSRPEAANALNTEMAAELETMFNAIKQSGVFRCVILTGAGKHFCAGADLKERKDITEKQWHAQHHVFERAQRAILYCPIPVIAAVNGAAFGGGLELALSCDFIYAGEGAKFALTEATLGIMPGMGGTQFLSRAVGTRRARELIFQGRSFSAAEAYDWGMVNAVHKNENLLDEAIVAASTIAANAPLSVKAIKQAVIQGLTLPIREALDCELTYYHTLLNTKDRREGINAFNEKRKPVFTGE